MFQSLSSNCLHICVYNDNVYEALSESQMCYISQEYLFLHIYDHLCIPLLAVIFVFAKAYKLFTDIHKYFTLGNHTCSFTSMIT